MVTVAVSDLIAVAKIQGAAKSIGMQVRVIKPQDLDLNLRLL